MPESTVSRVAGLMSENLSEDEPEFNTRIVWVACIGNEIVFGKRPERRFDAVFERVKGRDKGTAKK
jgi:hypothetical protein